MDRNNLTACMDTRVSPAGTDDPAFDRRNSAQSSFQLALDCGHRFLNLKAEEISTVIADQGTDAEP